jgi:hypothetical protein
MRVRRIDHELHTLAVIIERGWSIPEGANFHSDPSDSLQVATMLRPSGHIIKPHFHPESNRVIASTCEVIIVQSGKLSVDLYGQGDRPLHNVEVKAGDAIVLLNGGHGITMMEDSMFWEVKQGPFLGGLDKVYIEGC